MIGVLAVASIGMIGANMTEYMVSELSSDANSILIMPGSGGDDMTTMIPSFDLITEAEFRDISRIAAHHAAIPVYQKLSVPMTVGSKNGRASLYGLPVDDIPYFLKLERGSLVKGSNGAIVGGTLANKYNLKIGSKIQVENPDTDSKATLRVVGIAKKAGMGSSIDADNSIVTDEKWFSDFYGRTREYDFVQVVASDINVISDLEETLNKRLNKKKDVDDFIVFSFQSFLESITASLGMMTLFLSVIGGISLLVAAVSIFNVMMMSVTERVNEIGILRSIGTKKREILRMFLYESVILGVLGSLVGGTLSFFGGLILIYGMAGNLEYFFTPASLINVIYGILSGITICILSGMYPAWKAANMDPIVALRAE
jgi:putative ABC transport system permease protein